MKVNNTFYCFLLSPGNWRICIMGSNQLPTLVSSLSTSIVLWKFKQSFCWNSAMRKLTQNIQVAGVSSFECIVVFTVNCFWIDIGSAFTCFFSSLLIIFCYALPLVLVHIFSCCLSRSKIFSFFHFCRPPSRAITTLLLPSLSSSSSEQGSSEAIHFHHTLPLKKLP